MPRKPRLVKQRDAMQCGVASLAMICSCFGRQYPVDRLEAFCTPTREGVSMKGIGDAATRIGLEHEAARLTPAQLAECPLPAILHWNDRHFVVLWRIGRGKKPYCIADPAAGMMKLGEDEFRRSWCPQGEGVAMFFAPGDGFGDAMPEQPPLRSLGLIMSYLAEYRKCFYQIVAGLAIGCVLQLLLPFLTQSIVDKGINDRNIPFIWLVLLGEILIVAGRTATDFVRRRLLLHISMRVNISLVSDFFIKLLKLPMGFFDSKLQGDLLQRISDHTRVQSFLTDQTLNVIFTVLSFLIWGVVLLVYDYVIFLIFLLGSIAYGIWIATFISRRKTIDYRFFEQHARNQDKTLQLVTAVQEIKLQGCETRRRHEWEDVQADLFDVQLENQKMQQNQEAGSLFINEIKNVLITVFAATAVIDGQMTLGAMLAVQFIVGQLNSPISQLMSFVFAIQDVKLSLERINEIRQRDDEEPADKPLTAFDGDKSINLDNVDFRYDRHAPDKTIDGISLHIPAGKTTAIVGASGCGKTTLIKLMLGYYPPESGGISIAGRPIGDYSLRWWRSQCGVVMQDGVIFSESIARNIAVADGDVDMARVRHAARLACIDTFIDGLPLGYSTLVGSNGTGLSQGQRQRLLIARAIYKDPAFIFLDEATNSLDAGNERRIVDNLAAFYRGRTVVVVAHRLSTVKDADNIVVVDNGRIAEQGTHAELTARWGAYYSLVKNQLELGT